MTQDLGCGRKSLKILKRLFLCVSLSFIGMATLTACSTTPPADPQNLCSIFQEKDGWYASAHKVHKKYGVPINIAMSIMYQESRFVDDAEPSMRWFLFIPYGRGSSAYGYAQAQDPVWDDYVEEAGSVFSSRDNFEDSLDFIAWYMVKTKKINGIPFSDAYNHYLNYHEGWTGFKRGTYKSKDWLIKTARAVQSRAEVYKNQLLRCQLY